MLTISWSQLRLWSECRQKAYLVANKKSNASRDLRNFLGGSVVDRVMREWLSDPLREHNGMSEIVDLYIDKCVEEAKENKDGIVKWRNVSDRKELTAFCVELVTRLEPILNRYVVPYEFEVAKRFSVLLTVPYLDGTLVEVRLVGELDLFVRVPGGFVVWDLKGTSNNDYWRKVLGQLVFYDISMRALYGEFPKHTGLFQPMCKKQVLDVNITPEARTQMLTRIVRMCQSIWQKDYALKADSKDCAYCQVRHSCERYSPKNLKLGSINSLGVDQSA